MSAYVVDRDHIAYLVSAAMSRALYPHHGHHRWIFGVDRAAGTYSNGELPCADYKEAARVGEMLWSENVASVRHRYEAPDELPGPIDAAPYLYGEHRPYAWDDYAPVQVLKACDCYAYQSCEHPGWEASEAKAFIDSLRSAAWHVLPGYEDAAWGAPPTRAQRQAQAKARQTKAETP